VILPPTDIVEREFRGAAKEFQDLIAREVIIEGPSETGKTLAILTRIHKLALKYPIQVLIVRKHLTNVYKSVLQTYEKKVVCGDPRVKTYGGEKPQWYDYTSGARIWVGGMDKAGNVLSAEYDIVYFNQAEEGTIDDWETLTTRATGRAGNLKWSMTCGDCNPRGSHHWILERAKNRKLKLLHSKHKDNPSLFDAAGNATEQGKASLATLSNLTGTRRLRLFEGKWTTPEGLVYDGYNADTHVVHRDPSEFQYWVMGADEGYTNPAVLLLIGIDGDNRLHIAQEFYQSGVLQSAVVEQAVEMDKSARKFNRIGRGIAVAAVDSSAAGLIADLRNAGIPAEPHHGRVLDGIAIVQSLLVIRGDNRPGLTIEPDCINTQNEFESYIWKPGKDEVVKENDHSMDAIRYTADWLFAEESVERQVIYQPVKIGVQL